MVTGIDAGLDVRGLDEAARARIVAAIPPGAVAEQVARMRADDTGLGIAVQLDAPADLPPEAARRISRPGAPPLAANVEAALDRQA